VLVDRYPSEAVFVRASPCREEAWAASTPIDILSTNLSLLAVSEPLVSYAGAWEA
jgi:hypothetical protein